MPYRPFARLIQEAIEEAVPNMRPVDLNNATLAVAQNLQLAGEIATSVEADFEGHWWRFEIGNDCRVSAGRYLLIPIGPRDQS